MSDAITLTLRAPLGTVLALNGLDPMRLAEMAARDIGSLPVYQGRRPAQLGDFFTVSGERSARLRIEGSGHLDGLGSGMTGGELIVDGDAGSDAGAGMAGGSLQVRGSVGHAAGMGMSGGTLRVDGGAGDRLGGPLPGASKGMTGGEIIVLGSAGTEAGARVRRGLIVIGGDAGPEAGRAMIAGTLVVLGSCGEGPGRGSKRGSIVACGPVTIPATYRYACTFQPPHVRLTLTYLKRRHGLTIDASAVEGAYRRYCGDAGDPGKGEILQLVRGV